MLRHLLLTLIFLKLSANAASLGILKVDPLDGSPIDTNSKQGAYQKSRQVRGIHVDQKSGNKVNYWEPKNPNPKSWFHSLFKKRKEKDIKAPSKLETRLSHDSSPMKWKTFRTKGKNLASAKSKSAIRTNYEQRSKKLINYDYPSDEPVKKPTSTSNSQAKRISRKRKLNKNRRLQASRKQNFKTLGYQHRPMKWKTFRRNRRKNVDLSSVTVSSAKSKETSKTGTSLRKRTNASKKRYRPYGYRRNAYTRRRQRPTKHKKYWVFRGKKKRQPWKNSKIDLEIANAKILGETARTKLQKEDPNRLYDSGYGFQKPIR